jgi:MFS family permease
VTPSDPIPRLVTPSFVLLGATGLAFFTAGGMVLPAASPYAVEVLAADSIGAGVAVGAFALAALAMRPVVGWASDRFGRRPLLIGGALLTVVALLLHLGATTLPAFIAVRAAFGVAEAFFFVSMLAAASDLAPPDRRGEALNLASLALYLGLAFGPPLGEVALAAGGYAAVWIAAATLAGVAAVLAVPLPETSPAVLAHTGDRVRTRLIHPAAVFPGVLVGCGAFGMAGFLAFIPLYARQVGLDGAAIPLAVYALMVVGLRFAFAKLPDQVGAARLSGGALAVAAVGLTMTVLFPSPIGLVVGTAVYASGVAFVFPALLSLAVSRVAETERGVAVGTTSVFLDASFGIAPAVFGGIAIGWGYGGAILLGAAVAALGAGLLAARRASLAAPDPDGVRSGA